MYKGFNIIGIGISLPKNKVTSLELDKKLGLEDGKIEQTTGLKHRYFLATDREAAELGYEAALNALSDAKLSIDDIDCIINSSATMDQAIPYNAAGSHRLLKPKKPIPSFDVNMTCLSTLRAMDLAAHLFISYKRILIISADVSSRSLDWNTIRTAGIFGDGASALVVEAGEKGVTGQILHSKFETHSEGYEYCQVRGGGTKRPPSLVEEAYKDICNFEMNGRKLYKISSQVLPKFINDSLAEVGFKLEDIDWVVPHQASQSALNHIVKILKIDREKLIDIFSTHGNQVASSIPIALHHLLKKKEIKSGQKVLLVGTSAGIGFGLMVWQMP